MKTPKFENLHTKAFVEMFGAICRETLETFAGNPQHFLCALYEPKAELLAQTMEAPIYLGAHQLLVKVMLHKFDLGPGDIIAAYDAPRDGSSVGELSLLGAVFPRDRRSLSKTPQFYVYTRAPYAGPATQSKAADYLLQNNQLQSAVVEALTAAPKERDATKRRLAQQVEANKFTQGRVEDLCLRHGLKNIKKQARLAHAYAKTLLLEQMKKWVKGTYTFEDYMEAPSTVAKPADLEKELLRLAVRLALTDNDLQLDFTGSAARAAGNAGSQMGASLALTHAAVFYVLNQILPDGLLLNHGSLEMIRLQMPASSIVNLEPTAALTPLAAETLIRLSDIIFGAFGKAVPSRVAAASGGSVNHVVISGAHNPASPVTNSYRCEEYVPCGRGAVAGQAKRSRPRVPLFHTPPPGIEATEHAYPLRIESISLRQSSGGPGKLRGGDGVEKVFHLLQPCTINITSERRLYPPYGREGGRDGSTGENTLIRNGQETLLSGKCTVEIQPGDRLRLRTPGGGGFGKN